MEVPGPLFQEYLGIHKDKVIPSWLPGRFSGSSLAPRIFGSSRWLEGSKSQSPSILGSSQGPSNQLPIRSIRSPIVSYIVPPSRKTTQKPPNSVFQENDQTSSPFLYDLLETEKRKLEPSTNVKNVENTIVEVKMLEKTEGQKKKIAGGQKRVCLAFCQSPTSCEHSHAS